MPYGGNYLAVGGFSLFGGNDFGGGGKTFLGDRWFFVFGGKNSFAEAVKSKYGGLLPPTRSVISQR